MAVTTVRRSLRDLEAIGQTADAVAAGNLDQRVPESDERTEIGRIAAALNGMLTHVESAFRAREDSEKQMRRFTADASHELRTPLTAIRDLTELSIENPDLDLMAMMRRIDAAAQRMTLLVNDLLRLARLDQRPTLQLHPVDLLALAADAVQEARLFSPVGRSHSSSGATHSLWWVTRSGCVRSSGTSSPTPACVRPRTQPSQSGSAWPTTPSS